MAEPSEDATPGTEIVRRAGLGSLSEKLRYAETLAKSGLLPTSYRRQPANVLYATEYGEMLGLAPLAAMNGLHIIEGKPTASSGMVSALVRRAGHRLRAGFDAAKGIGWCEIVRADDPDFTFRSEWTLARAVEAGLCEVRSGKPYARDSKGRPTPWERYSPAMMKARAITECARDACEEALNGVHYTPEELGVDVDENGTPVVAVAERMDDDGATDWDALLKQRDGNYNGLVALFRRAEAEEPDNEALLARIKAAGVTAKAAQQTQATIQADHAEHVTVADPKAAESEVVDAEIVDDPQDAPKQEPSSAEDELIALDQLIGDVKAADTTERVRELWGEARASEWLGKSVNGATVKSHLEQRARQIKSADRALAESVPA